MKSHLTAPHRISNLSFRPSLLRGILSTKVMLLAFDLGVTLNLGAQLDVEGVLASMNRLSGLDDLDGSIENSALWWL